MGAEANPLEENLVEVGAKCPKGEEVDYHLEIQQKENGEGSQLAPVNIRAVEVEVRPVPPEAVETRKRDQK